MLHGGGGVSIDAGGTAGLRIEMLVEMGDAGDAGGCAVGLGSTA